MSRLVGLTVLAELMVVLVPASLPAAPPGAVRPDQANHAPPSRELAEMFWMIMTKGANMGPTDGWFHPSASRYGWDQLKSRDKDGDEAISPDELCAPTELFRRLDRDRDGAINAEDFDWSPRSAYLQRQALARKQFLMMDLDTNGKISKAEWDAFFTKATKDSGALTLENLGDVFYPPPSAPSSSQDAKAKPSASASPSRWTLLKGLFKGELGSRFEGPNVGDFAPDFTLKTHDGKEEITLSKFRGATPVVLVFGSFT